MPNTILLKRSNTTGAVPNAASLEIGELAINSADAKLYTKKTDGTITVIGGSGNLTGNYLPIANWTGTDLATFTGLETSFGTVGSVMTGAVAVGKTGQIKLVTVSSADGKYSQVLVTLVGSSLSSHVSSTEFGCMTATTGTVKLYTNVGGNTTACLTLVNTGNLTYTETSGGFGYNNATKALESLTDIVPGNLSYINQKYADTRYVPKLANTTYGQANIPFYRNSTTTRMNSGWSLTTACGTGFNSQYFGQNYRLSTTSGSITDLSTVEMGAWGVDSTGNMTQGSAISALKTGFKVIAFGNTTSNTSAPSLRASVNGICSLDSGCVTINASNSTNAYSEISLDPATGIRMSHGLNPVGCLTFSSESASSPYKMVMTSTTSRSLTLGTIDSTRGGLLWSKSVSYAAMDSGEIVVYGADEDLTGKAVSTETHAPWLQLNQTGSGMLSGRLELYHNYNNGAGGANYSTGVAVYLDRVERYQSTGTANWTANSLITQGYADTRYAPIGGGGGTPTDIDGGTYS
jgi:hypothetical protein